MNFVPTAFTPSAPVGATRSTLLSSRCHVQQRKVLKTSERKTPTMVSPVSIATELLGAGVLGFGTYYFFFRDQAKSDATAEENTAPAPTAEKSPPPAPVVEAPAGIIGLAGSPMKDEVPELRIPTPKGPPPITPPPVESIGVNIADYLDSSDEVTPNADKQRRLEEELSFATSALSDLSDCDGAVIVDHAGDAVWASGDLVGDTVTIGSIPTKVRDTGEAQVINVDNNMSLPFLKPDVRNVAAIPIGETQAVLILASRRQNFFGDVEKRVATAVCGRLSHFLPTPPSVGA